MNYFEQYEQLKKGDSLLTIGSIWTDIIGRVRVVQVTSNTVYYYDYTTNLIHNEGCSKSIFLRHFIRII